MQLHHEIFRGTFKSWEKLLDEAGEFATQHGPERVISISHSCDEQEGVVVVWYWAEPEDGQVSE
jgi:hypothetical protein